MFSKALLSPKHTSQKGQFYMSPKPKDTSARKTTSVKGKSISTTSDFFDQKDISYTKESQHFDNESLLSTQIGSASNIGLETVSSLTHLNGGTEGVATIFNEKYCRKVLEEVAVLRKDLEQKNSLIEKLMKENGTLRREMEEFITAVDDAREHIDAELRECNQRVQDLEIEIRDVRQENKQYQDEIARLKSMPRDNRTNPKEIAGYLEEEADGFYSKAQKNMEDFYFRLNEQIADFMHSSQKHHEDFNKNIQKRIQGPQKETARKIEHVKTESSLPHYSSPLRTAKQNTSVVFEAKSPKGLHMTPVAKKESSRRNLDNFLSNTTEIVSPTSYSLCNTSPGYASISHYDKNYDEQSGSVFGECIKSAKKNLTIVSPTKGGMLRTKLKSDVILQEMKKKLSGL